MGSYYLVYVDGLGGYTDPDTGARYSYPALRDGLPVRYGPGGPIAAVQAAARDFPDAFREERKVTVLYVGAESGPFGIARFSVRPPTVSVEVTPL